MTKAEYKKLETILARVETLQNQTKDQYAKGYLGVAKSALLQVWKENK